MGNRFSITKRSRRRAVEERLTRPQRFVYEPANVDYKKLRKLILTQKLAPCFDGVEDSSPELEECPICFLCFPSLNRSKCCTKGVCTECFLQMKPSNSTRTAQCPFCKCPVYAVEYRGAKTQEEKNLEQAEDQKVLEAKMRIQSEESQDTNRVTLADQILSGILSPLPLTRQLSNYSGDSQDERGSCPSLVHERIEATRSLPNVSNARHEDLDLDLEEIMMEEAIWLSMQDPCLHDDSNPSCGTSSRCGPESASHGLNESRLSLAMACQGEISSAAQVTEGVVFATASSGEQNIRGSHVLQSVGEEDSTHSSADESFVEEARHSGAESVKSDGVRLEIGCLESSFSSRMDDDSWGSLHLDENRTSETGFVSATVTDVSSYSPSSVHSISDRYCGTRLYFDDDNNDADASQSCSHLSTPSAVRQPPVVSDFRL